MKRTALRSRRRPLPRRVRDAVFERDGYTCQMCGWSRQLYDGSYAGVVHHRYGGKGRPEGLDCILTLCWGCNFDIECMVDRRRLADARGLRLRRHQPAETPVTDFAGRSWRLLPDGTRTEL